MFFLRFYTMDNDIIFPEVKRRQVVQGTPGRLPENPLLSPAAL
jgi:hypothetical protein